MVYLILYLFLFSFLDYKSNDKRTGYFKWSTFHDEIKQFRCCFFFTRLA